MASALNKLNFEQPNPQFFFYLGRARYLSGDREPAGPARRLAPMDETYLQLAFTLDSLSRYGEAE